MEKEIKSYLEAYFKHPYFVNQKDSRIRVRCLPSAKIKAAPQEGTLHNDERLDKEISRLCGVVSRKMHVYYCLNAVSHDVMKGKFASDDDIEQILFIPLDLDTALPLPPLEIFSELGLQPFALVETSRRADGLRHQALIGLEVADGNISNSRAIAAVINDCCYALGSDPTVKNPSRIFRLPGSVNWKKELLEPFIVRTVSTSQTVYSLEEIRDRVSDFVKSNLSEELRSRAISSAGRESTERQSDKNNWGKWDAVITSGNRAKSGERHSALLSWAGQMCNCGMEPEIIERELRELAVRGCEPAYGQGKEELIDLERIIKEAKKYRAALEIEVEKALENQPLEDHSSMVIETLKDRSENKEGRDNENEEERTGEEENTHNDVAALDSSANEIGFTAFACLLARKQEKESEEKYLTYLAQVVIASAFADSQSGNYEALCRLLFERLLRLGVVRHQKMYVLRSARQSGLESHSNGHALEVPMVLWHQLRLTDDERESFLCEFTYELSHQIKSNRKKLKEIKTISSALAKNPKLKLHLSAKNKTLLEIIRGIERKILDVVGVGNKEHEIHENEIIFQNGLRIVGKSKSGEVWKDNGRGLLEKHLWLKGQGIACDRVETAADTPMFNQFLWDAFPGDEERGTREELVWRIIGYCLSPRNPWQKVFLFIGASGAGKGTLAELICLLCGKWNSTQIQFATLSKEWAWGAAEGKSVIWIDEAESADRNIHNDAMSNIKRYAGNEQISARRMRQDEIMIDSGGKLIITCNKDLQADDTAGALERRIVPLHFAHPKALGGQIDGLARKIYLAEGNLIASRSVEAVASVWEKRSMAFDVGKSKSLERGKKNLLDSTNPILAFCSAVMTREWGSFLSGGLVRELFMCGVRLGRFRKPIGRLDQTLKEALTRMGMEYGLHPNPNKRTRGYRNVGVCAEALLELLETTSEQIILDIQENAAWCLSEAESILQINLTDTTLALCNRSNSSDSDDQDLN